MCTTVYKETERCWVYNPWKDIVMHGQYLRELDGKDDVQSWKWIKDSDLEGCTEASIKNTSNATDQKYRICRDSMGISLLLS